MAGPISLFFRRIARKVAVVPTYARNSQVVRTLWMHSTPRKVFNLVLIELEYRLRKKRLFGRPYILVVDPTNVCNLRCPLCPTGLLNRGRPGKMMEWDVFTSTIDQLAPWAYKVNLFNWGESLLHSHIFEMIAYVKAKNLGTTLSTNLSLKLDDEKIDQLVTSGLEFICLSIDGVTQENYAHYRRKGELSLVLENVQRLVARRVALGSKTPLIEWQFIPMRHNQHEVEPARQLAAEMGVDLFRCIPVGFPFDAANPEELAKEWKPQGETAEQIGGEEISSNDQSPASCYFLYRYLVVNPDAKISPCCVVSGEAHDFGDLGQQPLPVIWNNDKYRAARSLFSANNDITTSTVCDGCELFKKRSFSRLTAASAVDNEVA